MAKAIALARNLESHRIEAAAQEALRVVLVGGCAIALIAAGRAFPF